MTKKILNDKDIMEQETMSKFFLGSLDTSLFLSYSITQFFSGSVGDQFDKRYVIAYSFIVQAAGYSLLSLAAYYEIYNKFYFYFCFVMIGLSQSMVFPVLVSVVGSWFSKSYRGMVCGSFGTSTNIGNIIGLQLAAVVLKQCDNDWGVLMNIITILFFLNIVVALTILRPKP